MGQLKANDLGRDSIPDTYAESHIGSTATKPGAAARNTAHDKAYFHYHRRHQIPYTDIPFPTPFHGSAKSKCGFLPQHHGQRVNCCCNHTIL